jgi:hypothetical protein
VSRDLLVEKLIQLQPFAEHLKQQGNIIDAFVSNWGFSHARSLRANLVFVQIFKRKESS